MESNILNLIFGQFLTGSLPLCKVIFFSFSFLFFVVINFFDLINATNSMLQFHFFFTSNPHVQHDRTIDTTSTSTLQFRTFFGRIRGCQKSFRNYLTFSTFTRIFYNRVLTRSVFTFLLLLTSTFSRVFMRLRASKKMKRQLTE